MKWYLVKIVYRIVCGNGNHTPQFDEQLRLIDAPTEEEAFAKAAAIGKREEDIFCNDKQQLVQWQFVDVAELFCFTQLIDGAELYSSINEVDDGEAYATFVHEKAKRIKERNLHHQLNHI